MKGSHNHWFLVPGEGRLGGQPRQAPCLSLLQPGRGHLSVRPRLADGRMRLQGKSNRFGEGECPRGRSRLRPRSLAPGCPRCEGQYPP
jgi:hypothetical protein